MHDKKCLEYMKPNALRMAYLCFLSRFLQKL